MQRFGNKSKNYTMQIEKLTSEYEHITSEQKNRIMNLRDENRAMQKKLVQAEQDRHAVSQALVRAEHASKAIVEHAKKRAEQIVLAARAKENASFERLQAHNEALHELSHRCDNIAKAIAHELSRSSNVFLLELPKKATGA